MTASPEDEVLLRTPLKVYVVIVVRIVGSMVFSFFFYWVFQPVHLRLNVGAGPEFYDEVIQLVVGVPLDVSKPTLCRHGHGVSGTFVFVGEETHRASCKLDEALWDDDADVLFLVVSDLEIANVD